MAKILVTGATGGLGKEVIRALMEWTDKSNIVALARNMDKAAEFIEKGIEVRQAEYNDYPALLKAFSGIDKLYFISGSEVAIRVPQHENVIKAAKETGIKHVVYTSFQRKNETETSPIAMVSEAHLKTEKWLLESGMAYTILKHNLYLDILPMFLGQKVLEKGMIYLPAGEGKTAFVLRKDMAEVGAIVLTTDSHENKSYDITAGESLNFQEIAEQLSEITGQTIKYISPSSEEFAKTLTDAGVPAANIGMVSGFAEAVKQGEFEKTSDTVEKLLGRKPVSVKDVLQHIYGK